MTRFSEIEEVDPQPATELEILKHGITEFAKLAPGHHLDPDNPCYGVLSTVRTFARRILEASQKIATTAEKTHNYKIVNAPAHLGTFQEACDLWSNMGWRVVAVVSDTRPGYAHSIVLERPVGVTHPND